MNATAASEVLGWTRSGLRRHPYQRHSGRFGDRRWFRSTLTAASPQLRGPGAAQAWFRNILASERNAGRRRSPQPEVVLTQLCHSGSPAPHDERAEHAASRHNQHDVDLAMHGGLTLRRQHLEERGQRSPNTIFVVVGKQVILGGAAALPLLQRRTVARLIEEREGAASAAAR